MLRSFLLLAVTFAILLGCATKASDATDIARRVDKAVQATTVARQIEEAASATLEARGPEPKPAPPIPSSWGTHDFSLRAGSICFPSEFQEITEDDEMFQASTSLDEEGVFVTWDRPSLASSDFRTQIDVLKAKLEEMRPSDSEHYARSFDEEGRLDAPGSPPYIVVTDESRISGLLDTFILSFAGDIRTAPMLVLVRHPETRLSRSALKNEVDIVSQIASCYRTDA